jgi:hypothetical protein
MEEKNVLLENDVPIEYRAQTYKEQKEEKLLLKKEKENQVEVVVKSNPLDKMRHDKIIQLLRNKFITYFETINPSEQTVLLNNWKMKIISSYCQINSLEIKEQMLLDKFEEFAEWFNKYFTEDMIKSNCKINIIISTIKNGTPILLSNPVIPLLREFYPEMKQKKELPIKTKIEGLFFKSLKIGHSETYLVEHIEDFKTFLKNTPYNTLIDTQSPVSKSKDKKVVIQKTSTSNIPKKESNTIQSVSNIVEMKKLKGKKVTMKNGILFENGEKEAEIFICIQYKNQHDKMDFMVELIGIKKAYKMSHLDLIK